MLIYLVENTDGCEFWTIIKPITKDEKIIEEMSLNDWIEKIKDTTGLDKDFEVSETDIEFVKEEINILATRINEL